MDESKICTPRDEHFSIHAEAYKNLSDGFYHLNEAVTALNLVKQFLIDELNETPEFNIPDDAS